MIFDLSNICACLGPYPGDPYCPCKMKQMGLDMQPRNTKDDIAEAIKYAFTLDFKDEGIKDD